MERPTPPLKLDYRTLDNDCRIAVSNKFEVLNRCEDDKFSLIWDCSTMCGISQAYIPFAAFNEHKKLTSGIAWRGDPNSLLSVGRDCLIHHAFKDATRPMEKVNPVGLDISVHGNISNATRIKEDSEPQGALAKNFQYCCLSSVNNDFLRIFQLNKSHYSRKSPAMNEHYGQVLSSVNMMLCEEEGPVSPYHLVQSAKNYLLAGKSLAEICEHNAAVAKKLNRPQIALTWQMLQLLYVGAGGGTDPLIGIQSSSRDDPAIQPDTSMENDQRSSRHYSGGDGGGDTSGGGFSAEEGDTETDDTDNHDLKLTHIASGMTINQDFFFGDGEINQMPFDYDNLNNFDTSQDWTLPNEAFQPRHEILYPSAMPPQEYHSKCSPREIQESGTATGYIVEPQSLLSEVKGLGTPAWECSDLVVKMLYHYASNGDVQIFFNLVILVGDRLKEYLDKDQVEHWFLSYIDLLQRFQLWNIANKYICPAEYTGLPVVQQQNQQSTTIALQCGQCGAIVSRNSLFCRKCGCPTSACAVCHGMVRGLFVWCQGCSHGGHLNHMMKWVANNKSCPAGCGHLCEYT
ncbi:LOW QUALITY PROTEIN: GATOR complex protein WDR24-like [Penaeus monodon]|uniref:LOW QUALITY PROTEIN: GATOR complex protein WDR24-like n=1 Tax=Penaeus monodon TaxID=6687 RepID=UPI0018A70C93|nr:LOW QUALITY PROTEIN: GATOR complex protein WDR24-like [Penaeus monodon]